MGASGGVRESGTCHTLERRRRTGIVERRVHAMTFGVGSSVHLGLVRVQNGRKRECMQHLRFKVTCGCEFEGFLI